MNICFFNIIYCFSLELKQLEKFCLNSINLYSENIFNFIKHFAINNQTKCCKKSFHALCYIVSGFERIFCRERRITGWCPHACCALIIVVAAISINSCSRIMCLTNAFVFAKWIKIILNFHKP